MGYYDLTPSVSNDANCSAGLPELSQRIETFSKNDTGVVFVGMSDVVASADPAAFDPDGIHPSAQSSRQIGGLIREAIRAEAQDR